MYYLPRGMNFGLMVTRGNSQGHALVSKGWWHLNFCFSSLQYFYVMIPWLVEVIVFPFPKGDNIFD